MKIFYQHYRLVLIAMLALLAGCRSERAAFDFGPAHKAIYADSSRTGASAQAPPANHAVKSVLPNKLRTAARALSLPQPLRRSPAAGRPSLHHAPVLRPRGQLRQLVQHRQPHKSTDIGDVILMAMLMFLGGLGVITGGLILAFSLGALLGIAVGLVAVAAGLIILLFSLAAATTHPGSFAWKPWKPLTILGWLLVALGLSPLLGFSWALLFPGSAILLISVGLLLAVYSQAD